MTALTWNLFHGRSQPPAGRDLLPEFTAALAGWDWDVAMLQEVPPWWPAPLARACGASMRMALTSRNALLPARKAIALVAPDVIKSGGGGCNAILVRGHAIAEHRRLLLTRRPERRVVHAVRLEPAGLWIANVHASKQEPRARALADVARAADALDLWTAGAQVVWGGDFNIRDPAAPGFTRAASHGVDHVLLRGRTAVGRGATMDAGPLSDHRPLRVEIA